ncbi:MAG TPA: nitrogen regulation protein NR(II) [Rudaea sp.]|jgi:two-component system nitrogen regulation sensor histidine kinase GlnL|uniref:nitrogen regulation protein NR(II) n=1 Tax=Rudaea sp. TaxID=2136325 RepID=UPI002F936939
MLMAVPALPGPALKVEDLLGQLETGVAVLDRSGVLVYANPAFCELFAVSPSRSHGLPVQALGEPARVFIPLVERVRAGGASVRLREQTLETRTGRSLHADIGVSLWTDDGVLLEVHELGADISAMPTARLSESLRGLAHEVKNPLAGLRGAAQLLKRRLVEPDLVRLAELVMSEADRLAALTDRLLQPGGKPHLSVLNLHEVAERARALIAAEAEPALRLERDYDPSLPSLRGNGDRLLQLVLNLMRNALQAKASRIGLRSRAEHNVLIGDKAVRLAARLDVIDDGVGVPETLRHTLFMPLVSGRSKGTGLGLALAQEIAQEHGGTLSYRSRPGQTVFSLLLPLGSEPARASETGWTDHG